MLDDVRFSFEAQLWVWDARRDETWTFVSLPAAESDDIRARAAGPRKGFGSVRVQATVGGTSWLTSIFPDAGRGVYVLPIKRAVRTAEGLEAGDTTTIHIQLQDG
jgi:hypothetical protein